MNPKIWEQFLEARMALIEHLVETKRFSAEYRDVLNVTQVQAHLLFNAAQQRLAEADRTVPCCRYCGSPDVVSDGTATYDADLRKWVLYDTFYGGSCSKCGEENNYFNWSDPND